MGASVVALLAAVSGKYVVQWALTVLSLGDKAPSVSWAVAFLSAFVGSYSHVALDSLVYSDVAPFWPCSQANPFFGLVSASTVRQACVLGGFIGLALYLAVGFVLSRREHRSEVQR